MIHCVKQATWHSMKGPWKINLVLEKSLKKGFNVLYEPWVQRPWLPEKNYEPLKYLLENDFFHEDARECILNILSVLEVRKVQTKASEKDEKSSKTPNTSSRGKNPDLKFSKQKNLRMERLLKKVTTLKMSLFSMTVVRRAVEVVKVIAKTESDLVLSPCETKHHV